MTVEGVQRWEVRLPPISDEMPGNERLAILTLAEAMCGEHVSWPADAPEGWVNLVHLAGQIPGAGLAILLPTGGSIVLQDWSDEAPPTGKEIE
jgi:hypothetical protein